MNSCKLLRIFLRYLFLLHVFRCRLDSHGNMHTEVLSRHDCVRSAKRTSYVVWPHSVKCRYVCGNIGVCVREVLGSIPSAGSRIRYILSANYKLLHVFSIR